jgi:hypothetical protein
MCCMWVSMVACRRGSDVCVNKSAHGNKADGIYVTLCGMTRRAHGELAGVQLPIYSSEGYHVAPRDMPHYLAIIVQPNNTAAATTTQVCAATNAWAIYLVLQVQVNFCIHQHAEARVVAFFGRPYRRRTAILQAPRAATAGEVNTSNGDHAQPLDHTQQPSITTTQTLPATGQHHSRMAAIGYPSTYMNMICINPRDGMLHLGG